MKWYVVSGILALLLGLASPLPIWPGPTTLRHLPPGIFSAVIMILSCLGARRQGSKLLGGIAIVYGCLAAMAGLVFVYISIVFVGARQIILVGSMVAFISGIITVILGWKTYKAILRN